MLATYDKKDTKTMLFSQNVQLTGHQAQILAVRFSEDGKFLASASMDKTVMLWQASGNCDNVAVLNGHGNAVTCLAFDHTNEYLYSGSADKSVIVWNLETNRLAKKYKGHVAIIHSVSAPKKLLNLLATGSDDGTVKIFDTRTKKQSHDFTHKYPITVVCLSEMGDRVFSGGIDNIIRCYNLKTGKIEYTLEGHMDTVSSLAISHDGSFLMSNSFDETVRIWDARPFAVGQRNMKTMSGHSQGHEKALIRGGWSFDGLYVATGSTDKCVYIWDTTTRKIVQKLGGHIGTVNEVCFNPKANLLASGSNDKTIIMSQLPDIFL